VLKVKPSDSVEVVRKAARQRRAEVHPDRHGGEIQPETFGVNEAADVLCDERRRAAYDATRSEEPDPFAGLEFGGGRSFASPDDMGDVDWGGLFR
jgi:DnaJ-class molecular chaperone